MATYEQSPQDEGYSEDPLTVGTASAPLPPWLSSMSISERTGTSGVDEDECWQ
jgi:F-box and WD-40 domain protein 1/11